MKCEGKLNSTQMNTCKYCGADSFPEENGVVKSYCKSWINPSTSKTRQSSFCKDRQISKLSKRIKDMTKAGNSLALFLINVQINGQQIIGRRRIPSALKKWHCSKGGKA